MEQEPRLDDRFTSGVWYDMNSGDFCKIQRGERNGEPLVELVNPENDCVYWDFPVDEWQTEQSDFRQVSDEAVEDPRRTVNRALRMMQRNDPNELMSYPEKEAIDLRYARQQVEIRKK